MKLLTQLAQLLQALPVWLLACLRRVWRICVVRQPAIYPTPFKPWFHPVSRRAAPSGAGHWRTKPEWVRAAVFDLALALPGAGYRTIANCFNLQQLAVRGHTTADSPLTSTSTSASVSKTFVAKLLTGQRAALAQARLHARSRRQARREPVLTTWGMDLTGLPLTDGSSIPVFGVIDHGSRAILDLQPVATYNSLILLGKLLITMGTLGKPHAIRSDNDAVFKTALFRVILKLIGVRQQFTDLGSPWQNGRIERFWRTLKSELRTKAVRSRLNGLTIQTRMKFASISTMHSLLAAFRFSYNAYRPHQSLGGITPAMVWNQQVEAVRLKLKTKAKTRAATKAAGPPRTPTRTRKARAPPT
jgi:putative transposase